jgi:hypothetical protein
MLDRSTNTTFLPPLGATEMKIQDLSKALDTKTMKTLRGCDNGNSATNAIGQVMNRSAPVAVLLCGGQPGQYWPQAIHYL